MLATNPSTDQEPQRYQSNAKHWFVESDPIWDLARNTKVNVGKVTELLDQSSQIGFVRTLSHYARCQAAKHTQNMAEGVAFFLRSTKSSSFERTSSLIAFRASLTKSTEYRLGAIRGFLYAWHDFGYAGVSDEVVDLLESWVLKGNIKGDNVKRLDPTQGPLTDNELLAFNEGAARAFEMSLITISDLAISLLESNTGRRPIQITNIKLCDLEPNGRNKKGEALRLIRIPRAKQQGEGFRESFKIFAINEELWIVICAQKMNCISSVEECLGYKLDEKTRMALPLFPDLKAFHDLRSSDASLSELLQTDHLHLTSSTVTQVLNYVAEQANCRSERTGDILNIFATRFRYTVGTRAVREGLGPMIIAELLDHTDTQQAGVYSKNVPEHAAILDERLSKHLAPYALAFQGVIVKREEDAKRGNDLCSRIRHHGEGTGICGTDGSCGANVPIPCYTCLHFQALLDGPHERVLAELISERQRILDLTGDELVADANNRTIFAVRQVIQRCRDVRDERTPKEVDRATSDAEKDDQNRDSDDNSRKDR